MNKRDDFSFSCRSGLFFWTLSAVPGTYTTYNVFENEKNIWKLSEQGSVRWLQKRRQSEEDTSVNGISYITTVWLNPTADINGEVQMDVETKAVEDPISWNLEELKEEALGNGIVSFGERSLAWKSWETHERLSLRGQLGWTFWY